MKTYRRWWTPDPRSCDGFVFGFCAAIFLGAVLFLYFFGDRL